MLLIPREKFTEPEKSLDAYRNVLVFKKKTNVTIDKAERSN